MIELVQDPYSEWAEIKKQTEGKEFGWAKLEVESQGWYMFVSEDEATDWYHDDYDDSTDLDEFMTKMGYERAVCEFPKG